MDELSLSVEIVLVFISSTITYLFYRSVNQMNDIQKKQQKLEQDIVILRAKLTEIQHQLTFFMSDHKDLANKIQELSTIINSLDVRLSKLDTAIQYMNKQDPPVKGGGKENVSA